MKFRQKAMDFYVAFLVLLTGMYGLLDPHWPPLDSDPWEAIVLIFEDIYLVIAGAVIMGAILLRRIEKHVICSIVMEMFGWLFVAVAAAVITLTACFIPPSVFADPSPNDGFPLIHITWMVIWGGLAVASFIRYLDMRHWWTKGGVR